MRRFIQAATRSRGLPWSLVGITLVAAFLLELAHSARLAGVPRSEQVAIGVLALAAVTFCYLIVVRVMSLMEQRRVLERRAAGLQADADEAYQRLEAIFRVSQRFIQADDENEIIEPVLRLVVNLSGAQGATFVPLDEHGQPQTALSQGDLPFPVMDAWLEYLTTSGVRERCRTCEQRQPVERPDDCPLLRGPFAKAAGLICFSVRRGEREFGVMNLFLPDEKSLDGRTRIFLQTLLDETALSLEGIYLRRRELSALRQMQVLRARTDLSSLLQGLLDSVYRSLEADFAILRVPASTGLPQPVEMTLGDLPAPARPFLDGLLQGVMASGEPVLLGDLAGDPAANLTPPLALKSLVAAPLFAPDRALIGAVLAGNRRARGFQPRQLALLQTFASQAALVVQNAALMAELEYKTMIQERARLAREIHDGLAQTIGFLKLQGAQLRGYMQRGEFERASQSVDRLYTALSEAYQDARQAIDGLRVSPDEDGLPGWLAQIASEFEALSGLPVHLEPMDLKTRLSPEVQAQLIRIVQEALSNIRKHARAAQVWIACCEDEGDLLLEVRDDGIGFTPEDVASPAQHGLRGMRERADLLGADFQIVSRPHEGAIVRIRLQKLRIAD